MRRSELAHILRAASTIAGDAEVLLVGSQSILGSFDEDDLPDEAVGSIEADVAFFGTDAGEKALRVDGAIGEDSGFHQMYGYYAQGLEIDGLVVLPQGWEQRVVIWQSQSSAPGRAHCLERHDLAVSKLAAFREKDREFVHALLACGLLLPEVLLERLDGAPGLGAPYRRRLQDWVRVSAARSDSCPG